MYSSVGPFFVDKSRGERERENPPPGSIYLVGSFNSLERLQIFQFESINFLKDYIAAENAKHHAVTMSLLSRGRRTPHN